MTQHGTKLLAVWLAALMIASVTVGTVALAGTVQASGNTVVNDDGPGDYTSIQDAVDDAKSGARIEVKAGTYEESIDIPSNKENLEIIGAGETETTIDVPESTDDYGMDVNAPGVTLKDFTLDGPNPKTGGGYGIKVRPNKGSSPPGSITIASVTVKDSGRSELDLINVNGGSISDVTLDGKGTSGVGLAITDSHGTENDPLTVSGIETRGNTWGGLPSSRTRSSVTNRSNTSRSPVTPQAIPPRRFISSLKRPPRTISLQ